MAPNFCLSFPIGDTQPRPWSLGRKWPPASTQASPAGKAGESLLKAALLQATQLCGLLSTLRGPPPHTAATGHGGAGLLFAGVQLWGKPWPCHTDATLGGTSKPPLGPYPVCLCQSWSVEGCTHSHAHPPVLAQRLAVNALVRDWGARLRWACVVGPVLPLPSETCDAAFSEPPSPHVLWQRFSTFSTPWHTKTNYKNSETHQKIYIFEDLTKNVVIILFIHIEQLLLC